MGLTKYIKADLMLHLHSEEDLPCKLTLTGLADFYNVSLTPVRTAVAELIDEGILEKQDNGRLAIMPSDGRKISPPSRKVQPPRTAADWEPLLIKEVMLSSLRSDPIYLREEALAGKLDVGRSVIRQALYRMAGAGLIEHVPRCGWLVHPIQESDVVAYLEIREALELKALDLSRPHLLPTVL